MISEVIPIIHVHGILGKYPSVPYSPGNTQQDIEKLASGIKIISEFDDNNPEGCSDEFREATRLLNQSEVIVVLGFGMAEKNMNRLRFFTPENMKSRRIGCSVGAIGSIPTQQLRERVEKLGIPPTSVSNHETGAFFQHVFPLE